MSQPKYCQGPSCHEYKTKDRIRGHKGDKHYETRKRSEFYYLGGYACDMRCQSEWFEVYGERALNHFGRITEAKVLTKDNAWTTQRNWRADNAPDMYYAYNFITDEQRPITEQQYNNEQTITEDGKLAI